MPRYEDPTDEDEYWEHREEEIRRQMDLKRTLAFERFIYVDPFYPPQWAAEEWRSKKA